MAHEDEILIFIKLRVARLMKANRVVVAMIVATAILVTPNILTNLVLVLRLNVRRMEEILVDELPAKERQVQRQTMSPRCMRVPKLS